MALMTLEETDLYAAAGAAAGVTGKKCPLLQGEVDKVFRNKSHWSTHEHAIRREYWIGFAQGWNRIFEDRSYAHED